MSSAEGQKKSHQSYADASDEIDLRELLLTLWMRKWFIVFVMAAAFCFAFIYTLRISTTYKTEALIQVENKQSGMDALQGLDLMGDMGGSGLQGASRSQVESALIQSRFILKPIIKKFHMDQQVIPNYFPFFGASLAKLHDNAGLAKPLFGMSSYAWGGEFVDVSEFKVPFEYANEKFMLVAGDAGSYQLYSPDGGLIINGKVNHCEKMIASAFSGLEVCVNQLKANKGEKFYLVSYPISQVVDGLSKKIAISDIGAGGGGSAGAGSPTGILNISLTGTNSSLLPAMLNTIVSDDVKKNTEKKSAEIVKTLGFLNEQLPIVKSELTKAETALSLYRAKTGSLGLDAESQMLLQQLVTAENTLEQEKLKKAEMLLRYTTKHPFTIAVTSEINAAQQKLNTLKASVRNLPKTEQLAIGLERDVQVKNQMYLLLLTRVQQMQVVQAGTISDVRILGAATPPVPLPSKKALILLGSLMFGFIFAAMIIFIRELFSRKLEDPSYVEEYLNLPIYAIIPYSKNQEKLVRAAKRKLPGEESFVLAERNAKDLAIEGMRSLRTTLQFALNEAKNNIIGITGSSPNIGKSFVSINLAYVLADAGKRVLLIDGDMRKGKMQAYFSDKKEFGLAEILSGDAIFKQAVQTLNDKIDFITTGHYPKNPSELLISEKFTDFLTKVSKQYDVILIDTPPILAVTDAMIITKLAGINLLVVGSGKEELKEVEHAVKRLRKNKVEINGLVYNNTQKKEKSYRHYEYNYYYDYEAETK